MSGPDLQPLLRQRLRGRFSALLATTSATIRLTDGDRARWTIYIEQGRISARAGGSAHPTTTVTAPLDVLAAVISGARSGVDAFLTGELRVRGNLALALQLDGLFLTAEHDHLARARTVNAGGVETFYLEAGPVDAPPVVLVHGLGATNASMLPLLKALSPRFHVLAPDLPGHGASIHGRDTYAAAFLGNWLLAFLDQTCDRSAVLIGNSLGGRTSLEAALLGPDLVRGLVLLCPAVAFRKWRQFVPLVRLARPELAALPCYTSRFFVGLGLRRLFADSSRLPDSWYQAAVDEFMRVMSRPAARVAFYSALRHIYLDKAYGDDGFWNRLPKLEPPALFVWGDRDVLVPARFARHISAAVPGARSVVLANCGHVPQFELPEQTAALTLDFIDSLAAPAGPTAKRRLRSIMPR